MKYKNRKEAGEKLADELRKHPKLMTNSVIMAIPRGGVPVAYAVSEKTKIPFYLAITKKLSHPNNPEVAIGAIAADGSYEINERVQLYGVDNAAIKDIKKKAMEKVKIRLDKYTEGREPILSGKKVIVIDDGIATGYTALVTGKYVRNKRAEKAILAIPVCPQNSITRVKEIYDELICPLKIDSYSFAVSAYYDDFHQNTDKELYDYLNKAEQKGLLYKEHE